MNATVEISEIRNCPKCGTGAVDVVLEQQQTMHIPIEDHEWWHTNGIDRIPLHKQIITTCTDVMFRTKCKICRKTTPWCGTARGAIDDWNGD